MRKSIMNGIIAGVGILALSAVAAAPTRAQGSGTNPIGDEYWMGRSNAPAAACPTVEWNVTPVPRGVAGVIKGVAFYSDMRGISKVSGSISADGVIAATVTSVSGDGPAGPVTGKREPDLTTIELRGVGCSIATFKMRQWARKDIAVGD
jgi:hypothetical protein